jgi:class 3 adenylate cyclase/pimeloyl-ACP methyl ester carboxylesterase
MQPETLFAQGPDGQVGYQIFGDGPIDLLFATPWVWNIDAMWEEPRIERFFKRLASFSRVIVFDKRGTGVSDPVPLGALPTLEEWADDIRVVMDAVESERAAIVAASESVPMSILFAASHPERTSAFVIVNGYVCGRRKPDFVHGLPPELEERSVDLIIKRKGTPESVALMAPSEAGDENFRQWIARFWRLSASPTASETLYRNGMNWDVRSTLTTVSAPTLVIHRADNRYFLAGHGRYMADHIPGATYIELPGGDQWFFTGDQDAILDEIQAFLTGARAAPDLDRILATVLFTDVVASTERAAQIGDKRWRDVLDRLESLSRREVDRHRGRFVNTTGDGVLATFDGPARAIRCAAMIADQVRGLGVDIRAGLHTGEVELRGNDVGGIAVNLAARVMGEAGPREVVVSSTVKDLVIGSGIEFEDRGAHELKGVPGEWRLYAVKA